MEQNPIHQPEDPKQEDAISEYIFDIEQDRIEFNQSIVKKARNALFLAGALIFASEMISMFNSAGGFNTITLIFSLIEGGVFVALALWTKRKPYNAVLGGIIAFAAIMLLAMIANGYASGIGAAFLSLISGFIFKIFILVALVNSLRNAKELQWIQRKQP